MKEKPASAEGDRQAADGDGQIQPDATPGSPDDAPVRSDTAPARSGGMLVAVRALEFAKRVDAANILRSEGARDVERADGTWQGGKWIDFDPLKPPLLVDLPAAEDLR
jgi:hypothetical protein